MADSGLRRFDRRRLLTAGMAFGTTFPLVLGYAGVQAHLAGAPRVFALGAGDDLSVLVTSGAARVLIATGTDTTAFGNALAGALPFGLRRIDLVLLAGSGRSASVAAHAARTVRGRAFAIVDPALAAEAPDIAMPGRLERLAVPRQYRLLGDISITIETSADDRRSGWRGTITRGRSRVVVLSDGRLVDRFPQHEPVSALIVTGGRPADAVRATRAPAVVVNAESMTEDALRDELAGATRTGLRATFVFPGQAKAIKFVDGGIRLPGDSRSIALAAAPTS